MPGQALFLLELGILSWVGYRAGCYPNGAPRSSCLTRHPKHRSHSRQRTLCPIRITLSAHDYLPEDEIIVIVEDPNPIKQYFSGIQMGAYSDTGNQEDMVGQFIQYPTNKLRTIMCFAEYSNMVTHSNREKVSKLNLTWKAPRDTVGNIIFKATIVVNFDTFWTDLEADLPSADNNATLLRRAISWKNMVKEIDFSSCGDTKGCFLHPQLCTGEDCLAAVTFQHRQSTDDYLFEIHTTAAAATGWISLGFSSDRNMGEDETISCVFNFGFTNVQRGWNPVHLNYRLQTKFLSQLEIRQSDGRLQCKFALPKESYIYLIFDAVHDYNRTYTKEQDWYLLLAWGNVLPASDVIAKHVDMPAVTFSKVNLKEAVIHRGSSFPTAFKVHASCMMVAWIFFGGIITVIARHYKGWMPKVTVFGSRVWFQIHRSLVFMVIVLTLIGATVIFKHNGYGITRSSIPHSYFGLLVVASMILQATEGLFYPGADHEHHYLFLYSHRILGQTTHILAGVTMFLAYKINYLSSEQKHFGTVVLSVWVVLQLLWHITYEVLSFKGMPLHSNQEESRTNDNKCPGKNNLLTILLVVYILTLAGLCTTALFAFNLY